MTSEQIKNAFTYHPPKEYQIDILFQISEQARDYALFLENSCPPSKELDIALAHLRATVMWANASILGQTNG